METRVCINCKIQMKEAWINTGAGVLILEQPIKGLKRKACGIDTYVCTNCGHVELVCSNTDIFK